MSDASQRRIVVVGGGTAGWMTAAALARFCSAACRVTLVESDEIGIVGVGEATIPSIAMFNQSLGIDEAEFLAATGGTYKLGIAFDGWGKPDEAYVHAFGLVGSALGVVPFHQLLAARPLSSGSAKPLGHYILHTIAIAGNRFAHVKRPPGSVAAAAALRLPFRRQPLCASSFAVSPRSAASSARKARSSRSSAISETGDIAAVAARQRHARRGRPVHRLLGLPRPADRAGARGRVRGLDRVAAVRPRDRRAVRTRRTLDPAHPRRSRARRDGNGEFRSSTESATATSSARSHISEDEAAAILLANLDGEAMADPRTIRFTPGIRRKSWVRNVVAIGLSSGFIEPLKSTSIHLIQTAISRLLELLPAGEISEATRDDFNERSRVRDGAHPRLHHPPLSRQSAAKVSRSGTTCAP